jgi:hypothetical protein
MDGSKGGKLLANRFSCYFTIALKAHNRLLKSRFYGLLRK